MDFGLAVAVVVEAFVFCGKSKDSVSSIVESVAALKEREY